MFYALAAGAALLGFWLYRRFRSSGRSKVQVERVWLLLGSGRSWSLREVEKRGFMLHDGPSEYPVSDCVLADASVKFGLVYVLAADSVHLVDYEQFCRIKRTAVKGAIFKPSGDLNHLLMMVGSVLVICAAVYNFTQSSNISATLVKQQAQIEKVVETLSRPLVVQK